VRLLPPAARGRLAIPPPALLALFYALLIAAGTVALKLPGATAVHIGWGDAAFTAVSAVTVTGLIVVDTGSAFTPVGQAVILLLIQLGGLGLMTFAALAMSMLGRPVHLAQQVLLREDLNQTSLFELLRLVRLIGKVALICEAAGAAALAVVFVPAFGWREGLWQALFHAVSAFNNAGFSLFPDSLSRWVADPVVNLAVPALILIGGIGFVVIAELGERRGWRRLSLHSKLTLAATAALLAGSALAFAALEWSNPATLGALPGWPARLAASWFQAVATRTAGFNTLDIAGLHDSTSLMFITLMIIGGGSASTAGGIKVTTFAVLLLATAAFFRGGRAPRAFGRSIGPEDVLKVLALATVSGLLLMTALFAISVTHDGAFLDLAFEVASAFGTVGLSRGATAELDALGRAAIALLMFVGRVGPLTLGFFLAARTPPRVRYPSGRIFLG
jgi:trk system potassium uptake protein TrkH